MSKITLEELSNSLKDHLNTLGLTQEQVEAMIQNAFTSENLQTQSKDIIGAINELFQSGNNVKQMLVDALIAKDVECSTSNTWDELLSIVNGELINSTAPRLEIKEISCGEDFSAVLKTDGTLWTAGGNNKGELGRGDTTSTKILQQVPGILDVKQISCGYNHLAVVKNDGTVWVTGLNDYGQLGLGDTSNRYSLTQVTNTNIVDVKKVVCGYYHTYVLKNDGTLYACGHNWYGQLMNGSSDRNAHSSLTRVTAGIGENKVVDVYTAWAHAFIVLENGEIWSVGYNTYGELGIGNTTMQKTPVKTSLTTNDVKQIACYGYGTAIVKTDGTLWACGLNDYGQLGLGDTTSRTSFTQVTDNVDKISCGSFHLMILKNDGSLWGCGQNSYSQLGLGNNNTSAYSTITQITTNINNDIAEIIAAYTHTIIIKKDYTLWMCGDNGHTTGMTSTTNYSFTQIPKYFSY